MCANLSAVNNDLKSVGTLPNNNDVVERNNRANDVKLSTNDDEDNINNTIPTSDMKLVVKKQQLSNDEETSNLNNVENQISNKIKLSSEEEEIPPKKRKTRRGKCKRRNVHPYKKNTSEVKSSNKMCKAEAPYNSNRFLIEDHGNLEEIDERLKNDQISTSTLTRTRDSSFSMDSDGEFYSTPDDEEEFLIKDFDDQYESLQNERLHEMSKGQLIQEYLLLEAKIETLNNNLKRNKNDNNLENDDFQKEIERLTLENEMLKRENDTLKSKLSGSCSTDNEDDSEDSETDSSDSYSSTSSSTSSNMSCGNNQNSVNNDYVQTNGRTTTTPPPPNQIKTA